ncbi:MAG: putative P-loop hydrolase [Candidatus Adlerbacteria bacterium]|nr:putative P-loop hydrolase [Candidatus Adlerbacteria bacterium]
MTYVPLPELPYFVRNVLAALHLHAKGDKATIMALVGEVGAGKTTFMQALAHEFHIHEVVQSPTYVLMKSYPINFDGFLRLIHIDAYRLESPEQFASLAPDDFLHDPTVLVAIEWPERVVGKLPKPDFVINFSSVGMAEHERHIVVA